MTSQAKRILAALAIASGACAAMFLMRVAIFRDTDYWYLNWNLFLAWVPLLFAWLLIKHLEKGRWLSWPGLGLTALWLGFLPNSFYIVTDFIHLQRSSPGSLLYDVVLILIYTLTGFILGYLSVFMVHRQLLKRVSYDMTTSLVGTVFLLSSFAIYLGRFLRWNTWDVVTDPAGIIFDVSDRILNPASHQQTFWVTLLFFVLLSSVYVIVWQILQAVPKLPRRPK